MSKFRLYPTPAQEAVMREHCAHARFVWNLAVEQHSWWRPGRKSAPRCAEQCRQLTEARADNAWLAAGSVEVQQQALRDFDRAMHGYFEHTHRRPTWRKADRSAGFRIADARRVTPRRLNRRAGEVMIPKVGWVRFRWSRAVPPTKSYRVALDRSGRWHVIFAAIPQPIPGPGTGDVVGVDRGVVVSAALSTGELLTITRMSAGRRQRMRRLQRRLDRAKRGSNRRKAIKLAFAKLKACEKDARGDWCEKLSTDLARRFDVIRIEDLRVKDMTRSARGTVANPGANVQQKAALNRAILASGWGLLGKRLEDKAPGRVQKVNPAYTSQRCSACGHVDPKSRESQARFRCTACGFACNADVNAALSIAAGYAVTARGGMPLGEPVNREPQRAA